MSTLYFIIQSVPNKIVFDAEFTTYKLIHVLTLAITTGSVSISPNATCTLPSIDMTSLFLDSFHFNLKAFVSSLVIIDIQALKSTIAKIVFPLILAYIFAYVYWMVFSYSKLFSSFGLFMTDLNHA